MLASLIRRLRLEPGVWVAILLATFAAWPFLSRASLPTFTDAEMHVYRTFEILSAWRSGVFYLRWAPDLFHGYGYPVFNYYSPLTYYLGAAYGLFFGGPVAGVKFVLVASIYLGALGMYLFVRDRWGGLAGVVGAAAFSLSPYMVYIDPHARGDAPETFALAVGVMALWAFGRVRRAASPGSIAGAGLLLAALILSHNLMAILFFGVLLAWQAWDVIFGRSLLRSWRAANGAEGPGTGRVIASLTLAVALGLGLAAVMWLPAVLEREAVQFRNVAGGTYFDFRRHFINVRELFAPSMIFDLGATQMRFHFNLGLPQWILGGLGLLSLFSPRTRRLSVWFFAFTALVLIYLMLPGSVKVWETIPPMAYLQFPTRLLGLAAVAFGILAGAAVGWAPAARLPWPRQAPAWLARLDAQLVFAALAVAACAASAMPLMYPPPWPDFGPVDAPRILATEAGGRGVGTTSANDFLPVEVLVVPGPQASLTASYQAGQVDKINRQTLPAGARVTVLSHGPEQDRFLIESPEAFVLRPYTFYFPGWTAYVDGERVPIEAAQPEGWITVQVPAGTHVVRLQLENTPPRWLGLGLSAAAAIGLLALLNRRRRVPATPALSEPLARDRAMVLAGVLAVSLALRFAADRTGWWRVQSTGTEVLVAQQALYAPLERNLALLAFDLSPRSARPGDEVSVSLYWKKLAPLNQDLRVFVHFIGPDGQLWGQSDKWNPADFPTSLWPLDHYVRDEHQALLRPGAPPGEYRVIAGLWDADTGQRMRLLDANGLPGDQDGIVLTDAFTVKP